MFRKLAIVALSAAAVAAPTVANAHKDHRPAGSGKAAAACKAERDSLGTEAFTQKYGNAKGKHALKRCKRQQVKAARQACKTERTADRAAFRAKYGKGEKKRHAFKRCVKTQLS